MNSLFSRSLWRAVALALALATVAAPAATLPLTEGQIAAMGLRFHTAEKVTRVGGYAYPAMVSIPIAHQAVVSAPVAGLIRQIHVVHGVVRKDQPLIVIESAKLLAAQQAWLRTLADLELARSELERARELHAAGSLSHKKFLRTQNRVDNLQREAEMRRQELRYMGLSAEQLGELEAKRRLASRVTLTAPRDGLLFDLAVVQGDRVDVRAVLAHVGTIDEIVVDVEVPVDDARELRLGQPVVLHNRPVEGRIAYIARRADPLTQRVTVHALFDNPRGVLQPGELVRLQFVSSLEEKQVAWRIPTSGVIDIDGVPTLFLRTPEGLEARPVEVLDRNSHFAVVRLPDRTDPGTSPVLTHGAVFVKGILAGTAE